LSKPTLRLIVALALLLGSVGCADILGVLTGGQAEDTPVVPEGTAPTVNPNLTSAADLSGIHGFGTVVQSDSGSVSARLDVITLGLNPRALGGIANPTITLNGATIPLLTANTVGVFVTNSTISPDLTFQPGQAYTFAFQAVDETGVNYNYGATVVAPTEDPVFAEIAIMPIRYTNQPVELTLFNTTDAASIRVSLNAGITFDTTAVASLNDAPQVLSAMQATTGPVLSIPATAFPVAGVYRIDVTALGIATPAGGGVGVGLGAASWFGAGTATSLTIEVQ
jgi:hypothetical protein